MSLAIDIDDVESVLIGGVWHDVYGKTFSFDAFEFMYYGSVERRNNGDPVFTTQPESTGFTFKGQYGDWISGPMSAIQAVRTRPLVSE